MTMPDIDPRSRAKANLAAVAVLAAVVLSSMPAAADIKICNTTAGRVGVALGYQDEKGWATEGWWNIASQSCETLLKGGVPSRFLYVYAVDYDRGGEWTGANIMCTADKSFMIRGAKDCQPVSGGQTGSQQRKGFFEVDTGNAKDWTVRLADPDDQRAR